MKNYLILSLTFFFTSTLFAQKAESLDEISQTNQVAIDRLTEQVVNFPQEKIYVQFDRQVYSAGDRIWYRIHMVNAATHTRMAISRYVYVELINAHNEVILRKKIRPTEDATYFGQIDLSPDIAQGWYSIRTYTNFMRNIDEDYFFRQNIYIGNPLKGLQGVSIEENTGSYNSDFKKEVKTQAEFDLQFFPEGGNLIAGTIQTVGFKAIGKNGLGTDINGRIIDDQNKELFTFKSSYLGMGMITFTPEAGKSYTAICEDSRGQSITVKLPPVSTNQYGLSIKHNNTVINIGLLTPNGAIRQDTLYLLGNIRGIPFLQATITPQTPSFTVSKEGINAGVTQFLLLNKKREILSERLIYISGNNKASLKSTLDKTNYVKRDAVHASLLLKDSKGNPLAANFSISVTDDNDVKIDTNETTIESYILLQSDLKGVIENPNNYFRVSNKIRAYELDLLMLTQGWKRYNVAGTLVGNPDKPTRYGLEMGPVITGKVQNFPARRGLPKINVSFIAHNNMNYDAVTTDNYGRFTYQCPEFPDSTTFLVQAQKKQGAYMELIVNKDTFPKVERSCIFPNELRQDAAMKDFMKKSRDRYYYQKGMMSVTLKDVVIKAKKVDKNEEIRKERGSTYLFPSFTFDEEDFKGVSNIKFLLMQAPGVTVDDSNNSIKIRGNEALIMVDNMRWQFDELANIDVSNVKLIDILREPGETMSYGMEGKNGVICIYLKRGNEKTSDEPVVPERNQTSITPLGHSLPAEFYVPKYQMEETKKDPMPDLRSTIFWKPNVHSDEKGLADIFFYTADSQGPFTITAEGISPTGEIIRYQGKINTKNK